MLVWSKNKTMNYFFLLFIEENEILNKTMFVCFFIVILIFLFFLFSRERENESCIGFKYILFTLIAHKLIFFFFQSKDSRIHHHKLFI